MKVNPTNIIALRNSGKTYSEISKELGYSVHTIMYHCNPNRKQSIKESSKLYQEKNPLISKMNAFLRSANIRGRNNRVKKFTLAQLLEKIGKEPKCYLTSRPIDLSKPDSYSLDHIVPASKGGESTLENCALLCKEANCAKQDLSVQEFIKLCKEVIGGHAG